MPFTLEKPHYSVSEHMNGHRFITTVSNPDLPVAIHIQSHRISFQECWSVSVILKLPNSTPNHICCQFETAYQLILQSWHTTRFNMLTPSPPPVAPSPQQHLQFQVSLFYSTAEEGYVFWPKVYMYFSFVSSLYVLATLTCRPDNAIICLR